MPIKEFTLDDLKVQFKKVGEIYSAYREVKLADGPEDSLETIHQWIDYVQALTKLKLMFQDYKETTGKDMNHRGINQTFEEKAFLACLRGMNLLETLLERGHNCESFIKPINLDKPKEI